MISSRQAVLAQALYRKALCKGRSLRRVWASLLRSGSASRARVSHSVDRKMAHGRGDGAWNVQDWGCANVSGINWKVEGSYDREGARAGAQAHARARPHVLARVYTDVHTRARTRAHTHTPHTHPVAQPLPLPQWRSLVTCTDSARDLTEETSSSSQENMFGLLGVPFGERCFGTHPQLLFSKHRGRRPSVPRSSGARSRSATTPSRPTRSSP